MVTGGNYRRHQVGVVHCAYEFAGECSVDDETKTPQRRGAEESTSVSRVRTNSTV